MCLEAAHLLGATRFLGPRPRGHLAGIHRRPFYLGQFLPGLQEPPVCLVGRHAAFADGVVDGVAVFVEARTRLAEDLQVLRVLLGLRAAQAEGALQFGEDGLLARLVAVKLQAHRA
jgi:hypothetical protein